MILFKNKNMIQHKSINDMKFEKILSKQLNKTDYKFHFSLCDICIDKKRKEIFVKPVSIIKQLIKKIS